MSRKTEKKVLSWIVLLTVVGTFLSTNVYSVMALESRQAETSEVELSMADSLDNAAEVPDMTQIEEEDTKEKEDTQKEDSEEESAGEAEEVIETGEEAATGIEEEKGAEEEGSFAGEEAEAVDAEGVPETGEEAAAGAEEGEGAEEEDSLAGKDEESTEGEGSPTGEETENVGEVDDVSKIEEEILTAKSPNVESPDAEIDSAEQIYMLYITHTLRYTKDGQNRHIQGASQVKLTQEDFEDGSYDLMKQAYDWEAVTTSPGPGCPEQIFIDDFWENGEDEREYYAEICYVVKDGWEVRFRQENSSEGSGFYSIYEGVFDNIEFVPAKSITLTIYYKYSNTGGLAGIDAHAPDEIVLPLKENGTADLENWRVPHYEGGNNANLEGFRIVLNLSPLNAFLVNPAAAENPSAYPNALENGDFNLRADVDTNSPEYQAAWDAARTITVDGITFTYIAPTTNEGTSATTSNDSNKQYTLSASGLTEDLTLTVYYRRAMGTYKVNYWQRAAESDGSDKLLKTMELTGWVGTLTNVKPLEEVPEGYLLERIGQKTIAVNGSTTVDVYYSAIQIRVIFNTDYIYIPRQQVVVGGDVDFSGINQDRMDEARVGYRFCGWQYKGVSGTLQDVQLTDDKLQLTSEFLAQADIEGSQETDNTSIRVLYLYPTWEADTTTVRVIFWTENLNGDDVKVTDSYYNFNSLNEAEKVRQGYERIEHQDYKNSSASYTNVGSFTIDNVVTNEILMERDGELIEEIQNEINKHIDPPFSLLGNVKVGSTPVELSDFYTQQGVIVLGRGKDGLSAAADGSTQVNVFFARKEYTLDFIYYFLSEQNKAGNIAICTDTTDFQSNSYKWTNTANGYPGAGVSGSWKEISQNNDGRIMDIEKNREVPRRTIITAKYGADLRSVWPGAENVGTDNDSRYKLNGNLRISWTPTAGIHHIKGNEIELGGNKNVPAAYSTMSAAIVANTVNNGIVHHLVAYWNDNNNNNTYRYNYCYEVPELKPAKVRKEAQKVTILQGTTAPEYAGLSSEESQDRNTLYLVPTTEPAFLKYGFSDLLTYGDKDKGKPANCYVVRIQNGKCYAISRQLVAISTRPISEQNPSARPNLILENMNNKVFRDHSTQIPDGGGVNNWGYNEPNNPYDIYFYYARNEFTITYMSDATTEIGKITLPYGARLYGNRYNIPLDYTKTAEYYTTERNGYTAWSTDNGLSSVCPGRRGDETRAWKFEGWSLSPSGDRPMEWETASSSEPEVIEGNLRLYAEWQEPFYTVEFDWNGGSIPPSDDGIDEKQLKSQKILANQSFANHGLVPRPVREGYILQGWQITHRGQVKGNNISWTPVSGTPVFQSDAPIISDLKVQAVWTPSGRAKISYTVYYLEKKTEKPVAKPKTVTGTYSVGTVVWEHPAVPEEGPYRNYVPLEENKSITLDTISENRLVFYYVEPPSYPYRVKFVEYGTDKEILSHTHTTKSASLLVYPEKEQVDELTELGYWVVDNNGNPQEKGDRLGKLIRPGVTKNPEAVFYVLPREYEICYTNLEVMGEAAERELRKLNPTNYTSQDPDLPKTLKNPENSYFFNGQEVTFLGWRMERTEEVGTVKGETPDFGNSEIARTVTIQPGSRGRLVFQAAWTPESYVVYFYPGSSGVFPGHEPFIDFGGLAPNTPLAGNIKVPTVIPDEDDAFIGWRWEEGANPARLYTEEEILAMRIVNRDLHFTACYQSDPTDAPAEKDPAEKDPEEQETPWNQGGSGSSDGSSGSGSSGDLGSSGDFDSSGSFDSFSNSGSFGDSDVSDSPASQLLPQTGMHWRPVWVLGTLGIMFLCVGIWREKKQGTKKEMN